MSSSSSIAEVLLIEDNDSDIEFTKETFSALNTPYKLVVTKDGMQAVDYLFKRNGYEDASTPKLILLDLNIPSLDGGRVLEIIKKDTDLHHVPVVILTGSKEQKDKDHSLSLYANCYMIKPDSVEKYMDMIVQIEDFWLKTLPSFYLQCIAHKSIQHNKEQ